MRNLILFLWRHQFTVVFLLLEAFAIFLIVNTNKYQRTNFLGWTNEITGGVYARIANAKSYLNLYHTNRQLAAENETLRNASREVWYTIDPRIRYDNDTLYRRRYKYIWAQVTNRTAGSRNNYLTLNRGLRHGIKPQMGVIAPNGVVGVVQNVSDNYCSVMSFFHQKAVVSVAHKPSGYFGPLQWDGYSGDGGILTDIPMHVPISKGDTLITRGLGTLYPPGITVGVVENFEPLPGTDFYEIRVRLGLDFRNLMDVYIVEHLDESELEWLESKNTEGDGR